MILTGKKIQELALDKNSGLVIEPFNPKQVNPNSYNLKLHNELLMYTDRFLDMKKENKTTKVTIPETGLILQPGVLYLGRTVEYTSTNGLVPMLEGRSSIGRLGLMIHVTAGFGDDGFSGYWTLELSCIEPIRIYPFVECCQVYYYRTEGERMPYGNGKYNKNTDIQASMLFKDFE